MVARGSQVLQACSNGHKEYYHKEEDNFNKEDNFDKEEVIFRDTTRFLSLLHIVFQTLCSKEVHHRSAGLSVPLQSFKHPIGTSHTPSLRL